MWHEIEQLDKTKMHSIKMLCYLQNSFCICKHWFKYVTFRLNKMCVSNRLEWTVVKFIIVALVFCMRKYCSLPWYMTLLKIRCILLYFSCKMKLFLCFILTRCNTAVFLIIWIFSSVRPWTKWRKMMYDIESNRFWYF